MSGDDRIAVIRDVLERSSEMLRLCRVHGFTEHVPALTETVANAQIELAFLESGVQVHRLPSCDCGCPDCGHS